MCLHVARSYTSSADSPFSLISFLILSNHLILHISLFFQLFFMLVLSFPSPSLIHSAPLFLSHINTISTYFPGLSLRIPPNFVVPLFLSFIILSSFVTQHMHPMIAFMRLQIYFTVPPSMPMSLARIPVPVLPLSCAPSPFHFHCCRITLQTLYSSYATRS